MPRIVLKNFGPVKDCDLTLNDFMVFTGPQASGKSTIAKAVYFFRSVKDTILSQILTSQIFSKPEDMIQDIINRLTTIFSQMFSSSLTATNRIEAFYYYSDTVYIHLFSPECDSSEKLLDIEFCNSIKEYFAGLIERKASGEKIQEHAIQESMRLSSLFSDLYTSNFIPAGRGFISHMAGQLSQLFFNMNDMQKLDVDFCIQFYLLFILSIRSSFSDGLDGLLRKRKLLGRRIDANRIKKARLLADDILKGYYQYNNGSDVLMIGPDNQAIRMNQASSGQQEAVWVTNILFYYLTGSDPVFLIVEEPESNLYPDTQKHMTELLTLFKNAGHQVLITTHSPYVLGTLNNLIYASDIAAEGTPDVEKVIDRDLWLDRNTISAWHMEDGEPKPATEPELGLIRNEYIEGASEEITRESDALYELSAGED